MRKFVRMSIPLALMRARHGRVSQEKIAEKTKISQRTISAIETGRQQRVDLGTLEKLAEFFDCQASDLMETLFIDVYDKKQDDDEDFDMEVSVFKPPPAHLAGRAGELGDTQIISVRFSPDLVKSWGTNSDLEATWGGGESHPDQTWFGQRAVFVNDGIRRYLLTHDRLPSQGFTFTLKTGPTRDELGAIPPERERVLDRLFNTGLSGARD